MKFEHWGQNEQQREEYLNFKPVPRERCEDGGGETKGSINLAVETLMTRGQKPMVLN